MSRGIRRQAPALIIAGLALVAALSGTVYAAAKINGKTIKVKSLPGNRLAMGSVPGNRLKPGAIRGSQLAPGSITGIHIDTSTLGPVPLAIQAERAQSAKDAETALNAVNAVNAQNAKTVNGYGAGCKSGTQFFAGACWQSDASGSALTATAAAAACATQGGELPDALSLVAFSQEPGVILAEGDEWTGDPTNISGPDTYAVLTVGVSGEVKSAASTATKKFRCVIPLVG
ncbi:MAG TPA: hypothetical protein VFT79_13070 [Solirubrobacterales bacterium]|nr:hypothetical protein [Solirubrobacterales bacterium]